MKTKAEIIELMKAEGVKYISLKKKETDALGGLYHLTPAGNLVDWNSKSVGKTIKFEARILHDGEGTVVLL